MLTFGIFLFAVALYVSFLLWCLAPLRRFPRMGFAGWLRIVLGLWLLAANFVPLMALPVMAPLAAINLTLADKAMAVTMFGRTLPVYAANVLAHVKMAATVAELEFPLTISSVRYRPRLRIACTHRKMISVDKTVAIHLFDRYPTASAGDFTGKAGAATVAISAPNNFCSPTADTPLQPGPYPHFKSGFGLGPSVFVIRGEADQTVLYRLRFDGQPAAIDDLVLEQPKIISVERKAQSEAIPLSALWPMPRDGEMSRYAPELAQSYQQLGARANGCIEFAHAEMDFKTRVMTTPRWRSELRDVPASERPAYCRRELARKVGKPVAVPLPPATE